MARKRKRGTAKSRSAAAKKAARTRKRNHAIRSAAARKAARTRKRRGGRKVTRRAARRGTRRVARRTGRRVARRGTRRSARRANPRRRTMKRRSRSIVRRRRANPRRRVRPMTKRELRRFRSELAGSRKRTRRGAFKNPYDRYGFMHRASDGEYAHPGFRIAGMASKRSRFAKRVSKSRRRRADGTYKNPFGRFSYANPAMPALPNPRRRKRARKTHPRGRRYANPFRDSKGRMRRNDGKFMKKRKGRKLSEASKLRRRQFMKTRVMRSMHF